MGRNPSNGHPRDLATVCRKHLRRAQQWGASLDQRIALLKKDNPAWTPTEEMHRDMTAVTQAISQASAALIRAEEADRERKGSMTNEQLTAMWKGELKRLAKQFTDDDWAELDAIRAAQVAFEAGREATQFGAETRDVAE